MKPGYTADEIRQNIERQAQKEKQAAERITSSPVRLYAFLNIRYVGTATNHKEVMTRRT